MNSVPTTIDFDGMHIAVKLLLFFVIGHVGFVLHYLKLYAKSETQLSFREYFFKVNVKASLTAYVSFVAAALGILFTIGDEGFKAVLLAVFSTGYALDSAINSDQHLLTNQPDNPESVSVISDVASTPLHEDNPHDQT